MDKKYVISASPHTHSPLTTPQIMRDVIIALIPALLVSIWFLGIRSLYVSVISVAACVFFEYFITKFILNKTVSVCDYSAVVTGLLLAFNLPSNLPEWIIIIGALVAIGIGKMTFGGIGNNPFNPALVGRVFLLISFPVQMTTWPIPQGISTPFFDVATGATPLALFQEAITEGNISTITSQLPSIMDMFLGNRGGSMGEIAVFALLIGFVYLLIRKVITWHIPITIFATVFVFSGILWACNSTIYPNPIYQLFAGGLVLGAVFMATDYTTSPMSVKGMIVYAIGIGVITVLIRLFGSYPEGVSFAILIMNAFTPLINTYIKPKRFGEVVKNG